MMIRPIAIGRDRPDAPHISHGRSDADDILFSLLKLCGCKNVATNEFYKQSSNAKPYLAVTFSWDSTDDSIDIARTLSFLLPSFKIHKRENQYLIYGDENAVLFFFRHFLIQALTSIQKKCPMLACKAEPSNAKLLYSMRQKIENYPWEESLKSVGCLLENFFNDNDDALFDLRRMLSFIGLLQRKVPVSKASYLTQDQCGIHEAKTSEHCDTYCLILVEDSEQFFKTAILPSIQAINKNNKEIALLGGFHTRCGARSPLLQAQKKSSIFEEKTLGLVFKLSILRREPKLSRAVAVRELAQLTYDVASLKKYSAASSPDDQEIKSSIELVYENMILPKEEEKRVAQSKRGEGEATVAQDDNLLTTDENSLAIRYGILTIMEEGLPPNVHKAFHNNVKLQEVLRILLRSKGGEHTTPADFYRLCENVKLQNALHMLYMVSEAYVSYVYFGKLCKHENSIEALAAAYDYWKSANFNNSSTLSCFSLHGRHGKNVTIAFVDNLTKVFNENHPSQELSALIDAYTKEWYRTSNPDKEGSRAAYAKRHGLFKDDNHQKLGLAATITSLRHGFSSIPSTKR